MVPEGGGGRGRLNRSLHGNIQFGHEPKLVIIHCLLVVSHSTIEGIPKHVFRPKIQIRLSCHVGKY